MMPTFQHLARAATAAALIAFTPVALLPQAREPLAPGARVRVEARALADTLLTGTVAFVDRDVLTLRPPGKRVSMIDIPISAIERIEISRGRAARPGATAQGGFIGAAVGALGSLALGPLDTGCEVVCGAEQIAAAVLGGFIGLLAGAQIGSEMKTGPERWYVYPMLPRAPAAP